MSLTDLNIRFHYTINHDITYHILPFTLNLKNKMAQDKQFIRFHDCGKIKHYHTPGTCPILGMTYETSNFCGKTIFKLVLYHTDITATSGCFTLTLETALYGEH